MRELSRADLHVHSQASDGFNSVHDLLHKADAALLSHLAVCDHDTIESVPAALQAGRDRNVTVIPGVEIGATLASDHTAKSRTSRLEPGEVHILGYGIDHTDDALKQVLRQLQQSRRQRLEAIADNLRKIGVHLQTEDILKWAEASHSPGRPHVACALVAAGYCEDVTEAFDRYLAAGKKGYVPRKRLECESVIEAIRRAGGLAVVAHPALLAAPGESILLLQQMGISGVEVVHQNHSYDDIHTLIRLCRSRKMIPTGGSDFHGRSRDPDMGEVTVPRRWAEALLNAIASC